MTISAHVTCFWNNLNQLHSNQIKSKVLFKVGTFTNSTNINSHELFKPTYILRYKLQHNKTMSYIKTTYQANIRCKHIYDLIYGPSQSVHMLQAPLCTLTVIGPENSIEIDADNYSIYISKIHNQISVKRWESQNNLKVFGSNKT